MRDDVNPIERIDVYMRGYDSSRVPENEILTSPHELPDGRSYRHPETSVQALMEAAPYEAPLTSREETSDLFGIVRDAFDALGDEERLLLEAVIFERLSFRQLERRFGKSKSALHVRYTAAILALRAELVEYPIILEYLDNTQEGTE